MVSKGMIATDALLHSSRVPVFFPLPGPGGGQAGPRRDRECRADHGGSDRGATAGPSPALVLPVPASSALCASLACTTGRSCESCADAALALWMEDPHCCPLERRFDSLRPSAWQALGGSAPRLPAGSCGAAGKNRLSSYPGAGLNDGKTGRLVHPSASARICPMASEPSSLVWLQGNVRSGKRGRQGRRRNHRRLSRVPRLRWSVKG